MRCVCTTYGLDSHSAAHSVLCDPTTGFITVAFPTGFGFNEAICVTICVGFSIDFVAHVAIAYIESPATDSRYARTRKALSDLGVSITGACITTFGASFFLFFSPMTPMKKIGQFICFDIAFALLIAVTLFSALLVLVGPVQEKGAAAQTGSLEWLVQAPWYPRWWPGTASPSGKYGNSVVIVPDDNDPEMSSEGAHAEEAMTTTVSTSTSSDTVVAVS